MMTFTKKHFNVVLTVLVLFALSGCGGRTTSISIQTWIDAPRLNTTYASGETVDIVLHATDHSNGSISAVAVFIGDELLVTLANGEANTSLVTFNFSYLPPGPGEYVLEAVAQNGSGTWGPPVSTTFEVAGPIVALPADEVLPEPIPEEPIDTTCEDRAEVVSQSLTDGQTFNAGDGFSQTWTLRNSGTCTWNADYRIAFSAGANFTGSTVPASIGQTVSPGGQLTIPVDLVAPNNPGNYLWAWALQDSSGGEVPLDTAGLDGIHMQFIVAVPTAVPPTNTPIPADTQNPVIIELEWSPTQPFEYYAVSFHVFAQDNVGVTRIELYFVRDGDAIGAPLHVCDFTSTCDYTHTNGFPWGFYKYFAIAYDAAGNQVSSFQQTVQILEELR